jgi:hypothetical protein
MISENGKYITQESSPLSGKLNHFLNPFYFSNINPYNPILAIPLIIIVACVIYFNRKK